MRLKFKTKFLILSLLFIIIPAVTLSLIFIFQFFNFTKKTIEDIMTSSKNTNLEVVDNGLKLDMMRINNVIEKLTIDARVLASSPILMEYLASLKTGAPEGQSADALKRVINQFVNLYENSYTMDSGTKIHFYPQLRFFDLMEKEVIKVINGKDDKNLETRKGIDWIEEAKTAEKGEICFSRVQISKNTKKPELRISTPVYSDGKIMGIITMNLNWIIISNKLKDHIYGKTGYCYVINDDGVLIIHPKYTLDNPVNLTDSKYGSLSDIIKNEIQTWKGGICEYEFEGVKKIVMFMSFKLGHYNYCLAAGVPVEEFLETGRLIEKKADEGIFYTKIIILLSLLLATGLGIPIAIFFSNKITAPVLKAVAVASTMSNGDFTSNIEVFSDDEIGDMGKALNATCKELSKMISEIQENAEALAASSEEVSAISTELAAGAEEITNQTTTIAGATEEMSANIKTVDDAAGQMSLNSQTISAASSQISQNMKTVASAAKESESNVSAMASASEEMTATINEVAHNAQKANDTTRDAVKTVGQASEQVQELASAAQEINKIIAVIVDIAEQTKLLALNATIEAARAGEAGKGFAVVASEVKELAKQTNGATDDIKKRIMAMQGSTQLTVEKIKNVSEVIQNVNEIVTTIAAAVEEQNVTMKENSQNVAQVSSGIQEVTKNVVHVTDGVDSIAKSISESAGRADEVARNAAEASKGAEDVSKNVVGISDAVKETSQGAQQLNAAAADLANMAANLQEMMFKFKVNASYAEKEIKSTASTKNSAKSSPIEKKQVAAVKKPSSEHLPSLDEL